jgi:acyl transferase domain-containing protein/acyl-CoA synthetase (AMP-forming)/AMP-acid ligase II/acyl carrier protein
MRENLQTRPTTLTEAIRASVAWRRDRLAFRFLSDGEGEALEMTYLELDERARAIAVALRQQVSPGETVVLLFPPSLDFITAFCGCLYAGVIAVPTYPPGHRTVPRLNTIIQDSGCRLALTTSDKRAQLLTYSSSPTAEVSAFSALRYLATDEVGNDLAAAWSPPDIHADTLAMLQYTSGSTSSPRGVMVSQGNLLHNQRALESSFGNDENSDYVSWLPLFHDMGLICTVLQPLYLGATSTLMSPVAFLQRPARWLEAISRYQARVSGAPDFAYDLCVDKVSDAQKKTLDLSSWGLAFNGAEPIRVRTLERFAAAFAPCGFRARSLFPCYGLAEATLIVSGGHAEVFSSPVSCGPAVLGATVVIANPENLTLCAEGEIGEILVGGGSVAKGYWNRPEESIATFQAHLSDTGEGPFLRTGDLGFERGGEIIVAGRRKDLIVIRGVNHYPQDIELTISEAAPALRSGIAAAFSVTGEAGEEQLAVVKEITRENLRRIDGPAACEAVREAISRIHEIEVASIVLVQPGAVPKTTSGKVQRRKCREMFLAGDLEAVTVARHDRPRVAAMPAAAVADLASHPGARQWLIAKVALMFGIDPAVIGVFEPLTRYGIGSLQAVQLSGEMESALGRRVPPTIVFELPTIDSLAYYMAGATPENPPARPRAGLQEPIAIVGMACRFPGGATPEEFADLLFQGREQLSEVGEDRWDIAAFFDPDPDAPGKMVSRRGGFLPRVDLFDAEFFGISPREAISLDPQQRLLLEVSWEALERAGQALDRLEGTRTGVFGGICVSDYSSHHLNSGDPARVDSFAGTGSVLSIAMGRISYALGLRGPNMAIDTACSSSLVAVHLACQSLRQGECDLALAGGVNLILEPEPSIFLSRSHALSPGGRCSAFDAAADGYVRGEGCGMVVLRRLSDALAAKDNILAVIRGSAVNHDGRSNGLTAPNGTAQREVIQEAIERAGVNPHQVSYVETHGTGTPLGDPIEARALAAALREGHTAPLLIGSVKTNIGHLEAAAGVAGLIKTVIALQAGKIPATLNFRVMNPHISGENLPLQVSVGNTEWPGRRLAGVSSFGFSGTNAHVIVEEAPQFEANPVADRPQHLLALSAKTPEALRDLIAQYRHSGLPTGAELADFCYTANTGRSQFPCRAAGWGATPEEILRRLTGGSACASHLSMAFLFSGQGSQYAGMARQLYETQPVFREALEGCLQIEPNLQDALYGSQTELLDQTQFTQPALFAIEWSLAQMWTSWGIRPAAVLGHSVGEYVAACVAGVMDWQDGLRLVAARGRLMQSLPSGGEMWAVQASEAEVLRRVQGSVGIAAVNAAGSVVISGPGDEVRKIAQEFETPRQLTVSHAFHSALMEPVLEEMERIAGQIAYRPAQIPWICNLTGREMTGVVTARYWRDQLRNTVRFADGMRRLKEIRPDAYLEIGPGSALLGLGRQDPGGENALWLPTLSRNREDWSSTLEALGSLYERGANIDWAAFDKPWPRRKALVPTYPFQRKRYWMDRTPRAASIPLYSIDWRPDPAPASAPSGTGRWLILTDRGGLGERLAVELTKRGAHCTVVPYGSAFQAAGARVVHLWALESTPEQQEFGLTSLVEVIRQDPERVWVLTRNAQRIESESAPLAVAQASIWGLGKVAALEHTDIWGGLIDVDDSSLDALIEQLGRTEAEHVALRHGSRFAAALEQFEPKSSAAFHPEGAWLITGGAGGIGRHVAAWLKKQGASRVIVAGRHTPAVQIEAEFIPTDMSDAPAVRRLIDGIPNLRGVIHAAGELADGVLLNQHSFHRALAGKALGAWNLHQATADRKLDHFILFSSAASLEGSPGQGGYAAANAFLDGLAAYRQQQGLPALSINWGPWAHTGMAAGLDPGRAVGSIEPAAALSILGSLFRIAGPQVAVLPDKLHAAVVDAGTRRKRTARAHAPRDIRSLVETETRAVLGMDSSQTLDGRQPLSECGLNSLLAIELRNKLAAGTGRNLPPDLLFHYSSVERLADFLSEKGIATAKEQTPRPAPTHEPIAIVGMGCRFPQADNPEAFWQLLRRGGCAITEVPPDRWDPDIWFDAELSRPGTMNTRWGGFLEHPDQFDPKFFGISYREACGMDPQQRLLLEVVWEALENAAQSPERLAGSQTGVFIGISSWDYCALMREPPPRGGTGVVPSVAANRISYVLDLQGPSMAVDTACSSSLVAVDLACQNLRAGRCELAIAGGVNIILSPETTVSISQAGMMAPDGLCKTFDIAADGYVRSEGCGVVVLKRLSDAVQNRDPILAVIRGTAVLQDGRSNGLTAPNALAQQKVVRQALRDGDVAPEQIGFVEAHGTGTSLGDVVEVGSLAAVLGHAGEKPCRIGSLKTNMGHLEAAAGIAGVIKAVLALGHEEIPPHINLKEINPKLDLQGNRLRIVPEGAAWGRTSEPRIAGVSSFGFGGTIAHAVIEEAPERAASSPASGPALFVLSARSETALRNLALRYVDYLDENPSASLADICYTAAVGRSHFSHRLALIVESIDQLRGELSGELRHRSVQLNRLPRLAFVATDSGKRWGVTPDAVWPALEVREGWLAIDPREPLTALRDLYLHGFDIDWEAVGGDSERLRLALPTYPFERRRCWLEPSEIRSWGVANRALANASGD